MDIYIILILKKKDSLALNEGDTDGGYTDLGNGLLAWLLLRSSVHLRLIFLASSLFQCSYSSAWSYYWHWRWLITFEIWIPWEFVTTGTVYFYAEMYGLVCWGKKILLWYWQWSYNKGRNFCFFSLISKWLLLLEHILLHCVKDRMQKHCCCIYLLKLTVLAMSSAIWWMPVKWPLYCCSM